MKKYLLTILFFFIFSSTAMGYSTGAFTGQNVIRSTFSGWMSAVKPNNPFDTVELYITLEHPNTSVRALILDKNRNFLYSKVKVVGQSGWSSFNFGTIIDLHDTFYVGFESVGHTERLAIPRIDNSIYYSGSETLREYYTTTGVLEGYWNVSSGNGLNTVLANFIDSRNPKIPLPPILYGMVGSELNIYFDSLVQSNEDYYFDVVSTIGKQQNERWTFVPQATGEYPVTIKVYDRNMKFYSEVSTNVIVSNATTSSLSALFIGDSTTSNGIYTEELLNLNPNITLLGTQGTGLNKHEGRSGWSIQQYAKEGPFVNNGVFDFGNYVNTTGFHPDIVGINLGINDIFKFKLEETTELDQKIQESLQSLDLMVQNIKTALPNVRVGIMVTIPPSHDQDSFGENYGNFQTQWVYKRNYLKWSRAIIDHFNDKVDLVPLNVNLDTVNNMSKTIVQTNSRNPTAITRQNNALHPAIEGYNQIADTINYWVNHS